MTNGLETTFRLLTKTKNEAAIGLLIPALDAAQPAIQEQALRALLDRHCTAGHKEVVRRLHQINEQWESIIDEKHGRMTAALRDAVLAPEPQLCKNGCRAILWFREYDLMPVLINAAEDESNPNRELVSNTLLQLAEELYEELASPRDYRKRRDPQLVRQQVLKSLEESTKRYAKHRVETVIEAFLLLVHRDNSTLKRIMTDPLDTSYRPIIDVLTHSARGGIIRLVLSFLDDAHAPSSAITLLSHRSDGRFVECLLRKIGYEPAPTVAANLKKIDSIPWLTGDPAILDNLDDTAQFGAVQMAMRSGMARRTVFGTIERLMKHGKPGGRRAASHALAAFTGAEANTLAVHALEDSDPQVQANVLAQLRQRGVPGALGKLVDMVESPYEVVRRAARESLGEFNFKRFLAAFDMLDEQVRTTTGAMVRKIDPEAASGLTEELAAKSRTRRLRAIAVVLAMGAAPDLERQLTDRLQDEDHLVRAEAARALGECPTPDAQCALNEALNDRSLVVREAAEDSLHRLQRMPIVVAAPASVPALLPQQEF